MKGRLRLAAALAGLAMLTIAAVPEECLIPGIAPNHMALGGGGDATMNVTGTEPFDVSIHLTKLGDVPYRLYQWEAAYQAEGLAFAGGVAENSAATGLHACHPPKLSRFGEAAVLYTGGCYGTLGSTSTFVGELARFRMQCMKDGVFSIRLLDLSEDPAFGTSIYTTNGQGQDLQLNTSTGDLTVECSGIGATPVVPTATPTATPVPSFSDAYMLVDADPSAAGIQSQRVVDGEVFTVALYGRDAEAANGYQWELQWDDATLDAVSAIENSAGTGAYVCAAAMPHWAPPSGKEWYGHGAGCVRAAGNLPGGTLKLTTITLRCLVQGGRSTELHIVSIEAEDTIFGATFQRPGGSYLQTTLVDARVQCGAAP